MTNWIWFYLRLLHASAHADAICEDGWYSQSSGSGTCSHHGGVSSWVDAYPTYVPKIAVEKPKPESPVVSYIVDPTFTSCVALMGKFTSGTLEENSTADYAIRFGVSFAHFGDVLSNEKEYIIGGNLCSATACRHTTSDIYIWASNIVPPLTTFWSALIKGYYNRRAFDQCKFIADTDTHRVKPANFMMDYTGYR